VAQASLTLLVDHADRWMRDRLIKAASIGVRPRGNIVDHPCHGGSLISFIRAGF